MRRPVVLVLAATVLATGCATARGLTPAVFTPEGRLQVSYWRAYQALQRGDFEKAAARFAALRQRQPDAPDFALWEAEALVKSGKTDEAWLAVEAAVDGGLRSRFALERNDVYAPLRSDPRWPSLLDRADANARAYQGRVREAKVDLPIQSAPALATWAEVERALEKDQKASREMQRNPDWSGVQTLEVYRHLQRSIAKVRRYIADHPHAPDREEARLREIRMRISVAEPWQDSWTPTDARAIAEASDRLLAEFPDGKHRTEAELHKAVATLRAVLPETGWELGRTDPYVPNCAPAIPRLESLAASADTDARGADAQGFLAYCLWEGVPRDAERALTVAEAFLARDEDAPEGTQYWGLTADVRKVRLLGGSLPPFEVKDLAGNTWTPESMKGRVSILQFWSPG